MLHRLQQWLRSQLAVDVGTSCTRVALPGEGIVLAEPSVVAVDGPSHRVLAGGQAVGYLAEQMLGRAPPGIVVERPLAAGMVADLDLCRAMLRGMLIKTPARRMGLRPRVLSAVPGSITVVQKRALVAALVRAGAAEVWLVEQALAAAWGASLPVAEPCGSLICDVGAGTTEAALISMGRIVASRSTAVAGQALDSALVDHVRRRQGLRIGFAAAEQLRWQIGCAHPLPETRTALVRGFDSAGVARQVELTSDEVCRALAEPLERIADTIRQVVEACQADLAADLFDHGLVLTGGGALLAGLDAYLTEQTGLPTRCAPEPRAAVIRGLLACLEQRGFWPAAVEVCDDAF